MLLNHKFRIPNFCKGFTLLEVLLVVAVLAILSVISFGAYSGFMRNAQLNAASESLVFDLKQAQSKSMSGEKGLKWGIHFVNSTNDYYEIFSTPTDYNDAAKTIETTVYLPGPIFFVDPASSSTVVFDKIRGTIAAVFSVTLSGPGSQTKTINVAPVGNIY